MFYIKIISLIILLSQSLFTQAIEQTHHQAIKGENTMPLPNFQHTISGMSGLIKKMSQLNSSLTSSKAKDNPKFQELSRKKLEICDALMGEHLGPHLERRNAYIQANPGVRLADDGSNTLRNQLRDERIKTEKSIDNPDYIPDLPVVTMQVVPGKTTRQRIMEAQERRNNEIDKTNKMLGGKVFLKRSDYVERSSKKQNIDRAIGGKRGSLGRGL